MTAEERIERATAQAMERHALKQAHERLHSYRVGVKNMLSLGLPPDVEADLTKLRITIEDVEWRIEKRIRGAS